MSSKLGLGLFAARLSQRNRAARRRGAVDQEGSSMRAMFSVFPLLAIPVIIYNLMAMAGGNVEYINPVSGNSVAPLLAQLDSVMFSIGMIANVKWELTGGDVLIVLSIAFLFMEILKSTSTGTATIMNHAVSMMLFIVCLVEFLLMANFATSVFFIIMIMTLLDVLAGVVVTIVSARRDFGVSGEL
ncbi:MAG: hypothetical protein AAGK23_12195 [Pseudomonadota bacterium]